MARTLKARSQAAASPRREPSTLLGHLETLLVGQTDAIKKIVPFVEMYDAGLSPEGRPVGVLFLSGPTGTGKTRTVQALAEILHGRPKSILTVNCGEFQMEHEVSKLIGAPPGYQGHSETEPAITQQKLTNVTSDYSDLSLLLFDEIEKAAPSMTRLMLGILDKATLRLGDNTTVNFERTLIFMTSNLGGRSIQDAMKPAWGFRGADLPVNEGRLRNIAKAALQRKFSPEFVNQLDEIIPYSPLDRKALEAILQQILQGCSRLIHNRLGLRSFRLQVTAEARDRLLVLGTSEKYGARELKRTVQRHFMQPVSALLAQGQIPPGATAVLDIQSGQEFRISLRD